MTNTFEEVLQNFIQREKVSVDRLSILSGLSKTTLQNWSQGLVNQAHNAQDVLKIANALKLSLDETSQLLLAAGYSVNEFKVLADSLILQAQQNLRAGKYELALNVLQQALQIWESTGNKLNVGRTLNIIAQVYDAMGDYETALAYLQQSLDISQEIGDRSSEGTVLNNISQIYEARGDYETALAYLQQSLAIRQQIGDKAGEGATLNNLSAIYRARGDYETALAYLQQSLAIRQQIGDVAGLCVTLYNLGHIYALNGNLQEAVSTWVAVYRLAKQINLSQALEALASLAPQLGLPEGLAGWEQLAKKISEQEKA